MKLQQLFIVAFWLVSSLAIYQKLKKESIILFLAISWWCFWNLIATFSFTGLFPPGFLVQCIVSIFLSGTVFGLFMNRSFILLPLIRAREQNIKKSKKNKFSLIFLLSFILPVTLYFLFRTYTLLKYKYDPSTFRSEVFGLITGSSELFHNSNHLSSIYWLVFHPIFWATFFIGIVERFTAGRWNFLVLSFSFFILDSLITVGRFGIHYCITAILTLGFMEVAQSKSRPINFKKYLFPVLFLCLLFFLIFYIRRWGSLENSIKHYLVGYHTCSFSILEVELNNPDSLIFKPTFGKSFWGGILNLPRYISNYWLGIPWTGEVDIIGGYLHQNFLVGYSNDTGAPLYNNAFGSMFYSMYRDGRLPGIFMYGVFFGYIMGVCSRALVSKNAVHLTILIGFYFILIYGIFQPVTSGAILPGLVLAILFHSLPNGKA